MCESQIYPRLTLWTWLRSLGNFRTLLIHGLSKFELCWAASSVFFHSKIGRRTRSVLCLRFTSVEAVCHKSRLTAQPSYWCNDIIVWWSLRKPDVDWEWDSESPHLSVQLHRSPLCIVQGCMYMATDMLPLFMRTVSMFWAWAKPSGVSPRETEALQRFFWDQI